MTLKSILHGSALALALVGAPAAAIAQEPVTVGGAPMLPSRTIVENASQSADHTTLVAAVQAAGLVETLSGPGPFIVFAPTNAAFEALPEGTVETLLEPENRDQLTSILTYHVVAGQGTAEQMMAEAMEAGGRIGLETVQGNTLTVEAEGDMLTLTDAAGGTANITIADVMQSNGVVHVIDSVLMPE